jgi:predicted ATP-dependent protease
MQWVLIPSANRRHLMLRDDVVAAVRSGQFHIWTVEAVDELLELLTGLPCGEPDAGGIYPEGTLHRLVSDRLDEFARTLRAEEMRGVQTNYSRHPAVSDAC